MEMTEVNFYLLTTTETEKILPKLVEKAYEKGHRIHILVDCEERVEETSRYLWTYHPGSFLPHGTPKQGLSEHQPIWISADEDNINKSDILVQIYDSLHSQPSRYKKCLDIFNGHRENLEIDMQKRLVFYQKNGLDIKCWEQNPQKGWIPLNKSLTTKEYAN